MVSKHIQLCTQLLHSVSHADFTVLTKVGVLAYIASIFSHAFPKETFRLGVAWTIHLSTYFGHSVKHGKFSSCCWVGLQVLRCFIDDIYHCFAGNICSLVIKGETLIDIYSKCIY